MLKFIYQNGEKNYILEQLCIMIHEWWYSTVSISPIHTFVNITALFRKRSVFLSSRAGILTKVWIGDIMTIWNKEFQNSKMGLDVFKLSCRKIFLVILRRKIFFVLHKFSKKNWFFGKFFEILQVVPNRVLDKPYAKLEGWSFGKWIWRIFRVPVFLLEGRRQIFDVK
jgi:hypothetical protein